MSVTDGLAGRARGKTVISEEMKDRLVRAGAVAPLVYLLTRRDASVVENAAAALHYLAVGFDRKNVIVTAATAAVFNDSGASLGAVSTAITNIEDADDVDVYSRVDLSVPAIAVGENYTLEVTFTSGALPYVDAFTLDSVLYPIGQASLVSLNDMLEVRPDVGDVLARQGLRLGFAEATAAARMAGVYAVRALVDIEGRLRDACREQRGSRPSLVVQRDRLRQPTLYTAMKLIYAAESSNPEDGEDEAAGIYRHFRAAADAAWRGVGPLSFRYPTSSEVVAAGEPAPDVRCVRWSRV
jgi:hypothetical protein